MRVQHQVFRSGLASWKSLFDQAADFASRLGPDRIISISHSEDNNDGVVTIWYWAKEAADNVPFVEESPE